MVINEDGEVGIGNTNPSSALDVTGSVEISSNLFFNGAGNHYIKHSSGTASSDSFTFRFSDNEDVMIVRGDGKVGIGTTSPSTELDVNGTITATAMTMGNLKLRSTNEFETDSGSIHMQYNTGNDVEVGSTGTNADLVVMGRVGISPTTRLSTPDTTLHIEDDSTGLKTLLLLENTGSAGNSGTLAGLEIRNSAGTDSSTHIEQDAFGGTRFYTGQAAKNLFLTASADGTLSSASDFTVGGNLIVSGTTTTINTATVEVEDNILQLNTTQASPDTATATTSGISVYRGDGVTQASLIFDDGDDTWDLTNHLTVAGTITGNLTGNVTGNVTGSAATATTATYANALNGQDDRDMAPEDIAAATDFQIFFATKEGLEAGSGNSSGNYCDVIYLDSYSDGTGHDANLLVFDKSTKAIYHYQADQAATNWGTAEQIAYTSDITYTTAEQIQDIVGAMFTSNTETNITATYEDGDGTIDLVVAGSTVGDGLTLTNATNNRILTASGGTVLNAEAALEFNGTLFTQTNATGSGTSAGDSVEFRRHKMSGGTGNQIYELHYQVRNTASNTDWVGASTRWGYTIDNTSPTVGYVGAASDLRIWQEIDHHASARHFGHANDTIMTIDGSTDRVGIGVTSPEALLHLRSDAGDVTLKIEADESNDDESHNPMIWMAQDGELVNFKIGLQDSGNHAYMNWGNHVDQDLHLDNNGTERFRFTGDGKLGIGTTAPAVDLHIADATDPKIRVQDTTDNYAATLAGYSGGAYLALGDMDITNTESSWMLLGAFNSINNLNTRTRDFHLYGTNTTTGFYFDESAGTFGIGTTAPSSGSKLDVNDDSTYALIKARGTSTDYLNAGLLLTQKQASGTRGLGVFMHDEHNDNEWFAGRPYGQESYIVAYCDDAASHGNDVADINGNSGNSIVLMTIKDNGNVGIGDNITNPSAKLQVEQTSTTGHGLKVYRNQSASNMDSALVYLHDDSQYTDEAVLHVKQDGTGLAVKVEGALQATTKSFDIEHPTEEGKRLHHGSLEGPEHGVYIRGRLEGDTIELPDYWLGLVDEDTITVQLTPNKGFQQIYVDHIEDNKVYVGNTD